MFACQPGEDFVSIPRIKAKPRIALCKELLCPIQGRMLETKGFSWRVASARVGASEEGIYHAVSALPVKPSVCHDAKVRLLQTLFLVFDLLSEGASGDNDVVVGRCSYMAFGVLMMKL